MGLPRSGSGGADGVVGTHRGGRTIRQALAAAAPAARKPRVFAAPKLDPAKPLIDAMLREDLNRPGSGGGAETTEG
jgi:hypothetical protein